MARWLWAALCVSLARAWLPPPEPLLLQPRPLRSRPRRHAHQPQLLVLQGWLTELTVNAAIRAPHDQDCEFYTGHVVDEPGSNVAITECDGHMYGLLQVNGVSYALQPTNLPPGTHVLHRRDVTYIEDPPGHNLTDDIVEDLEFDFDDDDGNKPATISLPWHRGEEETEYFRESLPVTRPLSGIKGLWLEMAIVADYTMLKFHGRERVRHYILAILNIVSAVFNDPSLNSNMTLVINRLHLYAEKDSVINNGNIKKSLEAVNKWNYRQLSKLPPGSTGWDVALWMTRTPLGGPSGLAPLSGVCSRSRSAALGHDEGLSSAFVIAHELAHLLGVKHDTKECAAPRNIMSPIVLATLNDYAWSPCSKRRFHEQSKNWYCMLERSHDKGVQLGGAADLHHYVFSINDQCRSEFGDGFSVCDSMSLRSPCERLWCSHHASRHLCRTKRAPVLEGTLCKTGHWCMNGLCSPIPPLLSGEPQPDVSGAGGTVPGPGAAGDWMEWEPWSACSADCGYGFRTRTRACSLGGLEVEGACEGVSLRTSTCWAGRACAGVRDARADLCRRRDVTFMPYIHHNESENCRAWCVGTGGGQPSLHGSLPDGTPCSYEQPQSICHQGTCVTGKCSASDAACAWCPDGYCTNNTLLFPRRLRRGWTRLTMIPHEARLLTVHIKSPVPLRIAIKEKGRGALEFSNHQKIIPKDDIKSNKVTSPYAPMNLQIVEVESNVLNDNIEEDNVNTIDNKGNDVYEGRAVAAGTLITWMQSDEEINIFSVPPLHADLMILATRLQPTMDAGAEVQLAVNYSTPANQWQDSYRSVTERGPCSVSCGGGVQLVYSRCRSGHCAAPRRDSCNTHKCEFRWATGAWEHCSATCGEAGEQMRQLFCVPADVNTTVRIDLVLRSVSPALCTERQPLRQQPCNRLPCPVYWQEMPWTPCSTTCGRGVTRRPLYCPAAHPGACGPAPYERRRRCRLRRCPPRTSPPACRTADTSQYCPLYEQLQLARACLLAPFRKICCETCRANDLRQRRDRRH